MDNEDDYNEAFKTSMGQAGFGIYAASSDSTIFYHSADYYTAGQFVLQQDLITYHSLAFCTGSSVSGFGLVTNRIANSTSDTQARKISTSLQTMRHVEPEHNELNMPVSILIVIVFMASVSTAIIYPCRRRISTWLYASR